MINGSDVAYATVQVVLLAMFCFAALVSLWLLTDEDDHESNQFLNRDRVGAESKRQPVVFGGRQTNRGVARGRIGAR
jgi:hypothetical protein